MIALPAVPMLAGCGERAEESIAESTAENALSSVCDARADIDDQIQQLAGLTASTVTADKVSQSADAIAGDLAEIKNALADLSDDRQAEVETANQAFAATATSTLAELGTSPSAGEAEAALTSATQELAGSYRDTFAPIDCS